MTDPDTLARSLYDGLHDGRLDDVVALFTSDFRGVMAAGMPDGIGGVHDGPAAMRTGVYERVGGLFEMVPEVDEILVTASDRVVVAGRYCGRARSTGAPIEAAFVHLLRTREGRISELVQVTDTVLWHRALDQGAEASA